MGYSVTVPVAGSSLPITSRHSDEYQTERSGAMPSAYGLVLALGSAYSRYVSVLGSKRVSPPVDQIEPSGCTLMVCLRQSSWNSLIFSVAGSQRPSFLAPASVSHTEPSGAGTAEWISAGPGCGTRNSLISPLV